MKTPWKVQPASWPDQKSHFWRNLTGWLDLLFIYFLRSTHSLVFFFAHKTERTEQNSAVLSIRIWNKLGPIDGTVEKCGSDTLWKWLCRVSKGRDVALIFCKLHAFLSFRGCPRMSQDIVPLSWDKKVFLSRCPFVPGQKKFPCPAVPLTWDKDWIKNSGTNSSVLGHPGTNKMS